ncbi:MAG TPA: TAXI family TRAP transporter solute-binding subunit [Draconibacterium sp.]|nr:TAXI family TRAP transporter solute-binding subunit [Draconibacterium sp.]
MKKLKLVRVVKSFLFVAAIIFINQTFAQETIDVGQTGWEVKRPVLASACPHGCPWGELGEFVQEAMAPMGYEVILCRNCNLNLGPRIVATSSYPPELTEDMISVGTTQRVDAPIDFGITNGIRLTTSYNGGVDDPEDFRFSNLRLIAHIEDPSYLLVGVKKESGITDLSEIKEKKLPLRIITRGGEVENAVLDYYGLTKEALESWGGSIGNVGDEEAEFDVIIGANASPAQNPECSYWTAYTYKYDLYFLDLADELLKQIDKNVTGYELTEVKWGLLKGVDRAIPTVGRSGQVVFCREDTPEQAAYDVAKAVEQHRSALKWYIRIYSYDSQTVWKNDDVPLHPGAERYYREAGYIK